MSRPPESLRLVTLNKEIYTSNSTSSCSRFLSLDIPHLNSRLGQIDLHRHLFSHENVGISRLVKERFEQVELCPRKCRALPSLLSIVDCEEEEIKVVESFNRPPQASIMPHLIRMFQFSVTMTRCHWLLPPSLFTQHFNLFHRALCVCVCFVVEDDSLIPAAELSFTFW